MFVVLILFIQLTVVGAQASRETAELGRVINLPRTNVLEDFRERETSIFEPFPPECFIEKALKTSKSYFDYYASTKSFYSKLGTQTSLDASLQSSFSLGVTLNSVTQSISSKESQVSGISLIVEALTKKIFLDKDCQVDESYKFKKRFIDAVERLPTTIERPWMRDAWQPYHDFFETFGTHAITSVIHGARLKQLSFAQSSKSYSERDFQVKACISLAGPTEVGEVSVSACSNVTSTESHRASDLTTSDKLIIIGGTSETRNKLLHDRTKELIEQLLNEADESDSSVQHTFRAVWKILRGRFAYNSPNYKRALNLEYYYMGYLNYGCPHIQSEGLDIQKFDHPKGWTDRKAPAYECSLASQGCHSNHDCVYNFLPVLCWCRGQTCVRYRPQKLVTGVYKETAYANTGGHWPWNGCTVTFLSCVCHNRDRNQRRVVWSLPIVFDEHSMDAKERKAPHHHGDQHIAKDRGLIKKKGVERKF